MRSSGIDLHREADSVTAGAGSAKAQRVDRVLEFGLQTGQQGVLVGVGPIPGGNRFTAQLGGNIHLAADADADAEGGAGLAASVERGLHNPAIIHQEG